MADFLTIKDANGKEFSVDMAHIADINGDQKPESMVQDSIRNKLAFTHDTVYRNAKGEDVDTNQLVSDIKSGKTKIAAVDVDFEATHSGKNHNYCIYYSDSMEKDAESFTNPFSKPLLKNHDSYCEPIGRIRKAIHGDSSLTNERTAVRVTARVNDEDAMMKFIDGRYRTVSIGGTMGTVTCNICGKTILKDGRFKFCGHWKGETYKDQVCYWGARDIDYNELSVVNNPADDYAQVMSVTVLTDEDLKRSSGQNDNKEEKTMDGENTTTQANDEIKAKVFDFIDNLLATHSSSADPAPKAKDSEGNNAESAGQTQASNAQGTTAPENTEDSNANNANQQPSDAPVADTQDTAADAVKADLDKANADLKTANDKITSLEADITAKDEEIANLKKQIEDQTNEATAMKNQMVEVAKQNKKLVSDAIIMKEIGNHTLTQDKAEERAKELADKSMKELGELLDSVSKQPAQRTTVNIQNPTVPNNASDFLHKDKGDADTKDSQKENRKTVKDFADSVINNLPV